MLAERYNKAVQEFSRLQHRREMVQESLSKAEAIHAECVEALLHRQEAKHFLVQVGAQTQQALKGKLESLATMALQSVFNRPYKLILNYEVRRGQPECDIFIEEEGQGALDPMDEMGGGVVDVASLALRIVIWAISNPRPRPVMILDEPGKNVSRGFQPTYSKLFRELSKILGIQFIIVTHEPALAAEADRVFMVQKTNGISEVSYANQS